MKLWVGITDSAWYSQHARERPDEVNFWQPGATPPTKQLVPGDLFLFKLHSPDNYIVGGGFFVRFTRLPARLAWEAFGLKNGVGSYAELLKRVQKYRKREVQGDPEIGCSILNSPFFFPRSAWIPIPEDWKSNIVRGKTYDSGDATGAALFEAVQAAMQQQVADQVISEQPRFSEPYLARARLGQGTFRVLVTDAYHRRCAVTGEKTLPVLEAAHVRPHAEQGPNRVNNGLPLFANASNLLEVIRQVPISRNDAIDPVQWASSIYKPTPTIIEAAQALYQGHSVEEISRSDSGAINLGRTSKTIGELIDQSKKRSRKSICFITGVPGAGKTLAGLNIANQRHDFEKEEHAVFLSGNGPLVEVLREALARNEFKVKKNSQEPISKRKALRNAEAFIQNIHHFRDDSLASPNPPIEKVVVFDEAQRAWTKDQTASFMKRKKGVPDFNMSEPEFLISVMDRHQDWAVIICLVGGGQEINTGEAGLPEWFESLEKRYPLWDVYVSDQLSDDEYSMGKPLCPIIREDRTAVRQELHLGVSVRSFRSEQQSAFVKALLDNKPEMATSIFFKLRSSFPIVVTRELQMAKDWLKARARGTERYGLVASSGASRLRPEGINIKAKVDPSNWFLNDKHDVRSSYFLEEVATEFDIQGLELDWVCIGWDANFQYARNGWSYRKFSGTKWQKISDESRQLYLKNAYRVLLTRARQGLVIFVPNGSDSDHTRKREFYDPTFQYLRSIGIPELHSESSVWSALTYS